MCEYAVEVNPSFFDFVPRQLQTRAMCESVIKENIYFFDGIPDELKTQEMCERAVETRPTLFFEDVPDYFVTLKILELCKNATAEEGEDYRNRIRKLKAMTCIVEYKQRKAKKAKIKEELLPVAWHPDCVIDWCFSEDKKEVLEKLYE